MVDFGLEAEGRRLEWVLGREAEGEGEDTTLDGRVNIE